jgi:hypothetical protein
MRRETRKGEAMATGEHSDPRVRKIDQNLREIFDRQHELDLWSSSKSRAGTLSDPDRARYRAETRRNEQDKLANLKAMQRIDPSYRTAEISGEIRRLESEGY